MKRFLLILGASVRGYDRYSANLDRAKVKSPADGVPVKFLPLNGETMVQQLETPPINGSEETQKTAERRVSNRLKWLLLLLNCAAVIVGGLGAPLLTRLYYMHGGSRRWLMCTLTNAGFPAVLPPLVFLFAKSQQKGRSASDFFLEPRLILASVLLGPLMSIQTFTFSLGLSYLPLSTFGILVSTQLVFTAGFSWLIVKQRFTPYSINSIVLIITGAVLLGIHAQGDRPPGVSNGQYIVGFFVTLGTAMLVGLCLPAMQFSYTKATKAIRFETILQYQLSFCVFGTVVGVVGMLINKDFQAIPREARAFGLGQGMYCFVLIALALAWQLSSVGLLGLVYSASSLFAGIMTCVLLPISEVAAVVAYHEKFNGSKGISLVLAVWGLTSYFYGDYRKMKKEKLKSQELKVDPHEMVCLPVSDCDPPTIKDKATT